MKTIFDKKGFALAALLAGLLGGGAAQAQTRYVSQPQHTSVKVDGTSTTHDWEMESIAVGGYVEFAEGVEVDQSKPAITGLKEGKVPARVHAMIKVSSLHSKAEHMPDKMDELMQEAMKEKDFPRMEYTLEEMTPQAHNAGKAFDVDTKGKLTIAGVTNAVSFPATLETTDADHLRVQGSVKFKMTDYGVTPPAPNIGLGLMRCGDEVTITIDWMLQRRGGPAAK